MCTIRYTPLLAPRCVCVSSCSMLLCICPRYFYTCSHNPMCIGSLLGRIYRSAADGAFSASQAGMVFKMGSLGLGYYTGTQFTCFTGTPVQILTRVTKQTSRSTRRRGTPARRTRTRRMRSGGVQSLLPSRHLRLRRLLVWGSSGVTDRCPSCPLATR